MNSLVFRRAGASDADSTVPLIHDAGPEAIAYGFSDRAVTGLEFIRMAFADGKGFFGWRNHLVATLEDRVVAVSAGYGLAAYLRLTLGHISQVWRAYDAPAFLRVMRRGMQLQDLMPPPAPGVFYLANFGVRADLRSQGIGRMMLDRQRDAAILSRYRVFALDVAVTNPRALALYEHWGLRIVRTNRFAGRRELVSDTVRMEIRL